MKPDLSLRFGISAKCVLLCVRVICSRLPPFTPSSLRRVLQAFIDAGTTDWHGCGTAVSPEVNGVQTIASNDMLYDAMIAIANKSLNKGFP